MATTSKTLIWTGRVLTTLVCLLMAFSAAMKLSGAKEVSDMLVGKCGFPEGAVLGLGITEAACVLLYAFPRTAVLGAILLTGYLGGAVATHLRIGEPLIAPAVVGVVAWLGLGLREERLRALLPVRRG